ncbi:DUF397 domain-containing protein [Actinomycetospora succinea]|uniref:DUF397 domain-containing protein n=1 Tax=Actinomycetospora succinea TaxID=663603 RepID=UPI001FB5F5E5|nr:DUF397 domain-containing protein [Actinomycetospora succinea]
MTSPRPRRDLRLRTSSFCSDGDCVGVAIDGDEVRVVDTKSSEALQFTPAEWTAFVAGVKAGEFDLPR